MPDDEETLEMWEAIFGESGAIVAQFFVILIFVLILTGVCYWLFRRYYGSALPGGGRSRLPRLGVIDSLSIDHRHRLVLVRRDNVEHLLLIGKTTDLVVEPSIARGVPAGTRPRQNQAPRQQPKQPSTPANPQSAATPPQAAPPSRPQLPQTQPPSSIKPETSGISEPIPFPQNRRPQPRPAPQAEPNAAPAQSARYRRPSQREVAAAAPSPVAVTGGASVASASAHFEEPARPTRVEPAFSLADAIDEIADEPAEARNESRGGPIGQPAPAALPAPQAQSSEEAEEVPDERQLEAVEAEAGTPPPRVVADKDARQTEGDQAEAESDDEDRAATVSNLEQEMARLLGQITAKRDP